MKKLALTAERGAKMVGPIAIDNDYQELKAWILAPRNLDRAFGIGPNNQPESKLSWICAKRAEKPTSRMKRATNGVCGRDLMRLGLTQRPVRAESFDKALLSAVEGFRANGLGRKFCVSPRDICLARPYAGMCRERQS
jgi:hypothetical protein